MEYPQDGQQAQALAARIYSNRLRKDVTTDDRAWAYAVTDYVKRTGSADGWEASPEWIRTLTVKRDFYLRLMGGRYPELAAPWQVRLDAALAAAAATGMPVSA